MAAMGPIVEGDLTQVQLDHIRAMIFEGIKAVHDESQKSLATASQELQAMGNQIEAARTKQLQDMHTAAAQADARISEITQHLATAQVKNAEFVASIAAKEAQVNGMFENMSLHFNEKEKMIQDLETKQAQMVEFKNAVEVMTSASHRTIQEMTGDWRVKVEAEIIDAESRANQKFQEVSVKIGEIERKAQSGSGSTAHGGNSGGDNKSLIFERDLKLPEFPTNPNPEQFRRWLDLFGRHCNRIARFESADCVFEE